MLEKFSKKLFNEKGALKRDFRKITAMEIAKRNNLDYVPKAIGSKVKAGGDITEGNNFMVRDGKYILLYPANDGMPTMPFNWYGKFDGETKLILDNQRSFECITNLNEILLQVVRLYTKYIDDNVFISPYGLAIRLDDEVKPDYRGKASLVLTDNAICNNKVDRGDERSAKMYFLNEFLDHYIGWNFGAAVKKDSQLETELVRFNEFVIGRKLRKKAGPGFEVWESDYVRHYKFKA